MISRTISGILCKHLGLNKAILLFGARQVGKTTLLENLDCFKNQAVLYLNGDDADVREQLSNTTSTHLKNIFGKNKIVVIDEAQQIPNIGITLKLITDKLKSVQVIATGSSAFELANQANEPLTGRKFEFHLFPLTFGEMAAHHGFLEENRNLEKRMIFGYYPEIVNNPGNEEKLIKLIANSYLYKDLLMLENIKRSSYLEKILKALALQVGSEVSNNEIAQLIGTDNKTVEKYIDLLEKTYVIFKLPALNRNVRNEIKKGKKIFFWDNGIRNSVLGNFSPLNKRTDTGILWENFLISERMKLNFNKQQTVSSFFWRTTQMQEIDYLEEFPDQIHAFEFKWNVKSKVKFSKTFTSAYNVSEIKTITPNNLDEFLL